jgi:CRISPR/Cas system-associated endoribonuclease Cas2
MTWAVGENVRARRSSKVTCRAVIASIAELTVDVLWEQDVRSSQDSLCDSFIVTPIIKEDSTLKESTVSQSDLMKLLQFEQDIPSHSRENTEDLKNMGDQLLRLGDALAALRFYEMALRAGGVQPKVGSVVLYKDSKGYIRQAEVDCCNDADNTVDVTLESNEEITMPMSKVILPIQQADDHRLQEKILLNAGRCLLLNCNEDAFSERRTIYLKHAVLAFTLSLLIARYHDDNDGEISQSVKASLLLRCRAQHMLSKYPHAKADANALLKIDPDNKEGLKLLRDIECQQQFRKKADKKLAKEMCQWVQESTLTDGVSDETNNETTVSTNAPSKFAQASHLVLTIVIVIIAICIQKLLTR